MLLRLAHQRTPAVPGVTSPAGIPWIAPLSNAAGRPPVATGRLSLLPDGRLLYRLKRRWRNGTSQVIFEPIELVEEHSVAAIAPLG
jgi:hypothetical protein